MHTIHLSTLLSMSSTVLTLVAIIACLSSLCVARRSSVLMEERFDDCPCEVKMGGRAHRPWKIYYEIEDVREKRSGRKCSEFSMGPVPLTYNFGSQQFCTNSTIPGNGSYVVRSCIRENDDDAVMELFEVERFGSELCGSNPSQDEVQSQEEVDCEDWCSESCGGAGNATDTITAQVNATSIPTPSPSPGTTVVGLSPTVGTALRLIHGAIVTDEDTLAYVAAVSHVDRRKSSLLPTCTGSLIGKRWVLTAGHCDNVANDVVTMGLRWDDITGEVTERGETYRVKNVYRPENYGLFKEPCDPSFIGVHNHDVALLELKEEVDNAKDIAIHVNTDCNYPLACSHLRLSGHGRGCTENEVEKIGHVLRTTVVKAVDAPSCERLLAKANLTLAVHELRDEEHICAVHDECGSGLCSGDSGAPLVMRIKKEKHLYEGEDDGSDDDTIRVQVGVGTWHVSQCGTARRPDVFEPVSAYVEWIHNVTRGEAKMYPSYENRHTNCNFSYSPTISTESIGSVNVSSPTCGFSLFDGGDEDCGGPCGCFSCRP